jgi:hypothetical protein
MSSLALCTSDGFVISEQGSCPQQEERAISEFWIVMMICLTDQQ